MLHRAELRKEKLENEIEIKTVNIRHVEIVLIGR